MTRLYQFHTHRIIEIEANDEAEASRRVEAELHDDESVLSVEVIPATDDMEAEQ